MALSTDQFRDHLTASGLLSAEDLSALLASLPEDRQPRDGEQLARELVRQKKLTKYQAEQIYAGKGKGLVLGNYTILDKLGQGGMGMVLKAEHKRLKRLVAIKVMSPAAVKTPDALKRFHREVEAAAKLRHPNVVATDDADEAKGTHFLVMEYVEGSDLSAFVKKKGPLPVAQAVQCIIQAARGLEFAHQQGVVHRDIKPANLLIDAKGTVKILDMGLARIEGDTGGQAELTSTGAVMGTVDYMAPEQAMSTKTADARSDIYSLGISLWYLLAGKCAYDGDTLMAKLLAHRDAPIPSLCAVRNDVPESVDAVFQKMVAKQAKDRYQTMTEVIHELEACQNGTASASTSSVTAPSISDESNVMSFLSSLGTSSHPQITKQQAAPTATYAPADPTAEATLLTGDLAETTDPKTMTSARARATRMQRATPNQVIAPPWYLDLKVKIGAAIAAVLLLLGVVFLFQTPNGTLRVEILDPTVEVKVVGTTVTLKEGDAEPVSLKAGDKKLLVTQGDLSFETDSFMLKKGTETKVKVELRKNKLVATSGGKVLGEKSVGRKSLTTSTTDAMERGSKVGDSASASGTMDAVSLGKPGQFSLKFAPNDYVEMAPQPNPASTECTCEMWLTTNGSTQGNVAFFLWSSPHCGLTINPNGTFRFYTHHGEALSQPLYKQNQRVHLAGVNDTKRRLLYLNGKLVGTSTDAGLVKPQTDLEQVFIGRGHFDGWIDAIHISRVARYSADFTPPATFTPDKDSIALYNFSEGRGDVLHDISGNNLHGKIVGAKWVQNEGSSASTLKQPAKWTGWPKDAPPPAIAPFDAKQARSHQEAWAKYLGVPVEFTNSLGMKFKLIPPGEFAMGFDPALKAELERLKMLEYDAERNKKNRYDHLDAATPRHLVTIPQPYYIGVEEVRVGWYRDVMGSLPPDNPADKPDESVTRNVGQREAIEFCNRLSEREKRPPSFVVTGDTTKLVAEAGGYRLPTEAEWEFACRAGTDTFYFFGNDRGEKGTTGPSILSQYQRGRSGAQTRSNPFGLFDVYGGSNEWCWGPVVLSKTNSLCPEPYAASSTMKIDIPAAVDKGAFGVSRGGATSEGSGVDARTVNSYSRRAANRLTVDKWGGVGRLVLPILAPTSVKPTVVQPAPNTAPAAVAPPVAKSPFDVAQAKAHQAAWAKHLGTEVVKSNSIGMQMTLIPPGEFLMGSSDADITLALKIAKETKLDLGGVNRIQEERPQHLVRITKPFRLAAHEVTIGQFAKFVEQTKYKTQAEEFGGDSGTVKPEEVKPDDLKKTWRSPGYSVTDDSPVTQVSWNDAVVYCNWLSEQEKLEPCYQRNGDTWTLLPKANGYRLPTEAEWEYACRAGTTTQYSFGNDWQEHDKYGWSNKNAVGCSHAVGSLPANPFGLYDMHGNVWEWCQDWYDSKWYEKSPSDNPLGPSGPSSRLHRGGGWNDLPACSRSSYRYSISTPSSRASNRGFRPALSSVGATTSVTASSQPVTPTSSAGRNTPKFTNTFGMEFALVPKGKSWLGGGGGKPGEQEVEIKQDFYMGVYEVTQEEWEKVTGKNPSEFSRNGTKKIVVLEIADADLKRFPVEIVTWGDCQEFIKTLNEQVKETGWVYRLPTEVEWEYACRGGPMTDKAESAFDFYLEKPTNTLLASQANFFYTNLNRTTKVGSYSPNRLGLYDMHGNIGEWCLDEFPAAPNVPNGAVQHAVRGGSFDTRNEFRRTSFTKTYPLSFGRHCGLRLVRVPVGGVGTTTSVTPQPATSSKLFMHDPAFPQWLKDVQAMPAEKQIEAVSKKLMELNPGFDGSFSSPRGQPRIESGLVTLLGFCSDKVTDISPLRALVGLQRLWAIGAGPDRGKLSDLSPLRGMKLVELNFGWNPGISDLSPLNGTPLENLNIDDTRVEDLSALKGTPLKTLNICNTPVSDLSPLQGMPLTELWCHDIPVSDVSPLHDCKTLRSTNIRNTNVTPASVTALQKALPNCKIEWDDPAKATTPQPAASSKLFMHDPAFPQWTKDVQAMSAEKQIEAVRKKLMELNPGFDGKLTGPYVSGEPVIKDGVVIEVEFRSDAVADLSPVRAFSSLRVFGCLGVDPKANQLTDLAPLQGVRLTKVSISNTRISDLSPLKGMPLYYLFADNTQVSSLTPLEGMPLTTAWCYGTPVSDLSPLAKCKGLKSLRVKSTKVPPAAVAALQKALPDCKIEWDGPAKATTPQPETSSKLFMHDPAFPQWMKDVQAMTAVNQVDAVGKKLKELNPGFDEKLEHKIERDRVIELLFVTDHVTDISPVRALSGLKRLTCRGSAWKGALTDLRPVAGMQLQVFIADGNPKLADISQLKGLPLNELGLYSCHQVEDLSPVKGMPLNRLNIGNTKAMDLSSLQGMPLKSLNLFNCPARDLSPLKGMPLEELSIHTFDKVEDLTPIQSLPLKAISCVNKTERDVALLRSLKTVNKINSKPVAEFWKELDGK